MKELFHIKNEGSPVQPVLLLQAGDHHLAFAVTNKAASELYELAWCAFDNFSAGGLADFLSNYAVLKDQYFDIQVSFDNSHSLLVPSHNYSTGDGEHLVKTLFGIYEGGRVVSELIPEWQLYNAYAVDNTLWEWINTIFPFAKFRHQQTLFIKQADTAAEAGCMLIDFRPTDFSLLTAAGGKILLSKYFDYSTPEDVLFILLKTCQQYDLSQRTVALQLSGLIDKQSALYKELYQYFIKITFREAAWHTGKNDYAAHFFTSLNDSALCV